MIESGLYSQDLISPALESVLKGAQLSDGTTTPLSFLIAAARSRADNPLGSASILRGLDAFADYYAPDDLLVPGGPDAEEAFLLNDALNDARAIREKTGGKDQFIGLRHVMFAVLVPEDPGRFRGTFVALARGGTDPARLSQAIADFCAQADEKGESGDAWVDIIGQRLPPVLELQRALSVQQFVTPFRADDPLAGEVVDRSGAGPEAAAFATMICWHEFRPPLAVGVFGDWGSGKSFFMRQVHDRIAAICEAPEGQEDGSDSFLRHVVQIRFNAWHYADTNLWASLVEHILTQLDAWAVANNRKEQCDTLLGKLGSAREWSLESARALVARRQELKAARAAQAEAQQALETKRQDLKEKSGEWVSGVWQAALKDDRLRKEVGQAAADLGLTPDVKDGVADLRAAVERFRATGRDNAIAGWHNLLARRRWLAVLLIAAVLALPPLFVALLAYLDLPAQGAGVAGVLAPLMLFVTWMTGALNRAHAALAAVDAEVRRSVEEATAEETAQLDALREEVRAAEAQKAEAERAFQRAGERLAATKAQVVDEDRKEQLLNFIRRRAASDDYRNELGFIALVRRDFDELNRLMDLPDAAPENVGDGEFVRELNAFLAQHSNDLEPDETRMLREATIAPDPSDRKAFERIVLYIDDLDRCEPAQVVKVLQAVHLLLAYPLFVVFLAVDVRWLEDALQKSYPQFDDGEGRALVTPGVYLEKIFQIPYWVRPMSAEGTAQFMHDILGQPKTDGESDDAPGSKTDVPEAGGATERFTGSGMINRKPPAPVRLMQTIELSEDERAFLEKLAQALDGSPRRVLRFVNSYRLIKAGLGASDRSRLDGGGYRTALALLALQINAPTVFDAMASEAMPEPTDGGAGQAALPEAVANLVEQVSADESERDHWTPIIARFGFKSPQTAAGQGA